MNLSGQAIFAPKKVYISKQQHDKGNDEDLCRDSYNKGFIPGNQNYNYSTFTRLPDQVSSNPSRYLPSNFQTLDQNNQSANLQTMNLGCSVLEDSQVIDYQVPITSNQNVVCCPDSPVALSPSFSFNFSPNSIDLPNTNSDSDLSVLQSTGTCTSSSKSETEVQVSNDSLPLNQTPDTSKKIMTILSSSTSVMRDRYGIDLKKIEEDKFKERLRIDINTLKYFEKNLDKVPVNVKNKFAKSSEDMSLLNARLQNMVNTDKPSQETEDANSLNQVSETLGRISSTFPGTSFAGSGLVSPSSGGADLEAKSSHSTRKVTSSCDKNQTSLSMDMDTSNSSGINCSVSSDHLQLQIPDTSTEFKFDNSLTGNSSDHTLCQVCGFKAAGFYCGAFICEACKKFFMRACKQEKVKYVCLRDKKCSITKESRVQCQYCRYQKCLSLKMFCPGSGDSRKNEKIVGDIPCRVCGAPSSGFHFGALTCEGCKGFFRRMAKERETKKYQCSKSGHCEINTITRNLCKSCRFRKCLEAGMSIEGSRIGRQPNSIKHAISLELKKKTKVSEFAKEENDVIIEVKDEVDDLELSASLPVSVKNESPPSELPVPDVACTIKQEPQSPLLVAKYTTDDGAIIKQLLDGNKHLTDLNKAPQVNGIRDITKWADVQVTWNTMMEEFEVNAQCIIRFSKKVPFFRSLAMEDQIKLVQCEMYPLVILNMSRVYDISKKKFNYFNYTEEEREKIFQTFPMLQVLPEHFLHFGNITKYLQFSDLEYTFLSAMLLLNSEVPGLQEAQKVAQLQDNIMHALSEYEEANHPDGSTRVGMLVLRLAELQFIAIQHNEAIGKLLKKHPSLKTPQLYKETFGVQM